MNKDSQTQEKKQVRLGYSAYLQERCYQTHSAFLVYLDFHSIAGWCKRFSPW